MERLHVNIENITLRGKQWGLHQLKVSDKWCLPWNYISTGILFNLIWGIIVHTEAAKYENTECKSNWHFRSSYIFSLKRQCIWNTVKSLVLPLLHWRTTKSCIAAITGRSGGDKPFSPLALNRLNLSDNLYNLLVSINIFFSFWNCQKQKSQSRRSQKEL